MIGGVLTGLLFGKIGYYLVLAWCCVSIFVFMVSGVDKTVLIKSECSLQRSLEACYGPGHSLPFLSFHFNSPFNCN